MKININGMKNISVNTRKKKGIKTNENKEKVAKKK